MSYKLGPNPRWFRNVVVLAAVLQFFMMAEAEAEARAGGDFGGRAGPLGLPSSDWDGEVFGAGKAETAADEVEFAVNSSDAETGLVVGERREVERASSEIGGVLIGVVVYVLECVSAIQFWFWTLLLGSVHALLASTSQEEEGEIWRELGGWLGGGLVVSLSLLTQSSALEQ